MGTDESQLTSRLHFAADVIWDVVDEQVVICDLKSGEFYEPNLVGALIWMVVDTAQPLTIEELGDRLQDYFPQQERSELVGDARTFVAFLQERNLLQALDG